MVENLSINKVYQYLLIILAFLMPLTVFGANLIIVIICVLWLFSGDYASKFNQIISNKFILASRQGYFNQDFLESPYVLEFHQHSRSRHMLAPKR